jgi:glucans biosynthesis protein
MLRLWGTSLVLSFIVLISSASPAAAPAFAIEPGQQQTTTATPQIVDEIFASVARRASQLASTPYAAQADDIPAPFQGLDYDAYRKLRPRPEKTVWGNAGNPFAILPLPRGGFYPHPVNISIVEHDGVVRELNAAGFVDFVDYPAATDRDRANLSFSGFRAITKPGVAGDGYEFAVLQGGTYFRVVADGQFYGVSARAFSIRTGSPVGEEFPRFTAFWIIRPDRNADSFTAIALADSPSAASAWRFELKPGTEAVVDVTAEIYPRTDISEAGIAPMSSMYLHGAADPRASTDTRSEVHDSDGLAIVTASGERIWRPLSNPRSMEISSFVNPIAGFGFEQRGRDPAAYADSEARYERRPGVWVEPMGDWGPGEVRLLEFPTPNEYADNVAAFWRPSTPWRAGTVQQLSYRLHWGADPQPSSALAKVTATHVSALPQNASAKRVTIDFAGSAAFANAKLLKPDVWSTAGVVSNIQISSLPHGQRLTFDLDPGSAQAIELHAALADDTSQQTETWLFRWTPE